MNAPRRSHNPREGSGGGVIRKPPSEGRGMIFKRILFDGGRPYPRVPFDWGRWAEGVVIASPRSKSIGILRKGTQGDKTRHDECARPRL